MSPKIITITAKAIFCCLILAMTPAKFFFCRYARLLLFAGMMLPAMLYGAPFFTLSNGLIRVTPAPMDTNLLTAPWPADLESNFVVRSDNALRKLGSTTGYGNTFFENEKQSYPKAMASWLVGLALNNASYTNSAKSHLQGAAIYDTGSQLTDRVDYFPSFTLAGQMPKYFWFGKFAGLLDSNYIATMRSGAFKWTDDNWSTNGVPHPDPLRRPNPYYDGVDSGGWGPDEKNSWVDVRNTDNLKAMRDAGVYLFAAEVGNTNVANIYKGEIRRMVRTISRTGVSEWDSPNYYPWAVGPWVHTFTFAPDVEVKKMARGILDHWLAYGALKYWRGGFAAPGKRSNSGGFVALGAPPTHVYAQYFGDCPLVDPDPDVNTLHPILSPYRPPLAVAGVARKQFGPVEMLNTKPSYANWTSDIAQPETWETVYQGHTFQLGSVVSANPVGDAAPFSLMVSNAARGVDFMAAWSGGAAPSGYSPPYGMRGGDQMGQFRDLFIFLRPADGSPFQWRVPKTSTFEQSGGVWFFRFTGDATWAAIRPLGLTYDSAADGTSGTYVDERTHTALGASAGGYIGFAMEVGERANYSSFDAFKRTILARGSLDVSQLASGIITLTSPRGYFVRMQHNAANGRPILYRNSGVAHNWTASANFDLYKPVQVPPSVVLNAPAHQGIFVPGAAVTLSALASSEESAPLALGWKTSVLTVKAGGSQFTQSVASDGAVTWSEAPHTPSNRLARVEFYDGALKLGEVTSAPFTLDATFAQGNHTIRAKAISTDGQESWSEERSIIVDANAPNITTPPADRAAIEGSNVTFSLVAQGTTPITYQWLHNGAPLAGETNTTLTLTNVGAANVGVYTIEVANTSGTVVSASATLTVILRPVITQQPANVTGVAGGSVTFNVGFTGTQPLSFQWRYNNGDIPGATGVSLTLSNLSPAQAGAYRVFITNAAGAVLSSAATLEVVAAPADVTLITARSMWRYYDTNAAPVGNWTTNDFNDNAWKSGQGPLGYSDGATLPELSYGPDANNKYWAAYFRGTFTVTDPAKVITLTGRLRRDDGAVIYLNGMEIIRTNMPGGAIVYTTPANTSVSGTDETNYFVHPNLPRNLLREFG